MGWRGGTETREPELLTPLDLTGDGAEWREVRGDPVAPAAPTPSRRGRRIVVIAIGVMVAIVGAAIVQGEPTDRDSERPERSEGSDESPTTGKPGQSPTTLVDDIRAGSDEGAFGQIEVRGLAYVGGDDGLRAVDLGNGSVVRVDGVTGPTSVIAAAGQSLLIRQGKSWLVRGEDRGFETVDADEVALAPDGTAWQRQGEEVTALDGCCRSFGRIQRLLGATNTHVVVERDDVPVALPVDGGTAIRIGPANAHVAGVGLRRVGWLDDECSISCVVHVLDLEDGSSIDWIRTVSCCNPERVEVAFGGGDNELAVKGERSTTVEWVDLADGGMIANNSMNRTDRLRLDGTAPPTISWVANGQAVVAAHTDRLLLVRPDNPPPTDSVFALASAKSIAIAGGDQPTTQPFARGPKSAPIVAHAKGITIAGLVTDAGRQFRTIELDTGAVRDVELEVPSTDTFDGEAGYSFGAPVRVGTAWFIASRGYAFRIPDEGDPEVLGPAFTVQRAGDAAVWIISYNEADRSNGVRRWTMDGRVTDLGRIYGALTIPTDSGFLVELQESPTVPARTILYDPLQGTATDIANFDPEFNVLAGGNRLVTSRSVNDGPDCCSIVVFDVTTGATVFASRPDRAVFPLAMSPNGQWLLLRDADGEIVRRNLDTGESERLDLDRDIDGLFQIGDSGFVVASAWDSTEIQIVTAVTTESQNADLDLDLTRSSTAFTPGT